MENIRNTLQEATKNAYKATKGLVQSAKFSMELTSEETNLRDIYFEIGKKVHEIYAYGGSLGKFFDEKYQDILECEAKIKNLRKEVDRVRGNKTCAKCGKTSVFTSEFCPKCGTDLDIVTIRSEHRFPASNDGYDGYTNFGEPVVFVEKPASDIRPCPVCTKDNAPENRFCFSCGKAL